MGCLARAAEGAPSSSSSGRAMAPSSRKVVRDVMVAVMSLLQLCICAFAFG